MITPVCTNCKFYKRAGWFSIRGPICTNSKCDEPAFTHHDPVTGETREYEQRSTECSKARWGACGPSGRLWEPVA